MIVPSCFRLYRPAGPVLLLCSSDFTIAEEDGLGAVEGRGNVCACVSVCVSVCLPVMGGEVVLWREGSFLCVFELSEMNPKLAYNIILL